MTPNSPSFVAPQPGRTCGSRKTLDPNWDSECSNQACFGVPLYRLYQTGSEHADKHSLLEFIRMAGINHLPARKP